MSPSRASRRQVLRDGAVALGVGIAGCLDSPASSAADAGGSEGVTVLLNWKTNSTQAGYFVAKERGFYREEDVAVDEFVDGRGGTFAAKQVGLGNYPLGLGDAAAVLTARGRDLPVRSYATSQQRNDGVVYTVEEVFGERLSRPAQLAGSTVAVPEDSPHTTLAKVLVDRAGVRDVDFLGVAVEQQTPNLLSGNADAAVGIFNSPIALDREGYDASAIRIADHLDTVGRTVLSRPGFARKQPETVRAFLRGTARGWAAAANDPEAAMDVMVDAKPSLAKSREMGLLKIKYVAKHLVMAEAVREHGWGWQRPQAWSTVGTVLSEGGIVPEGIETDDAFSNELLDVDDPYVGEYADRVSMDYSV